MKASTLISILCTNGISMENTQIVTVENPLEDCCRLFGDFNSCILPSPGTYLVEWVEADGMPKIGNPDALLVLDDVLTRGLVLMYRIDD